MGLNFDNHFIKLRWLFFVYEHINASVWRIMKENKINWENL